MKRVLSLLLALTLVVGMFAPVYAQETENDSPNAPAHTSAQESTTEENDTFESELVYTDLQLDINWTNIKSVGHQIPGGQACACYALAYCRTLLDGKVHYYSEYNLGSNEYDALCNWSYGSYSPQYPTSKSTVYNAIYSQLTEGNPVVVRVTGSRGSHHYVTVVGFTNVTSLDSLSASNFLIIDPVASSFAVENMAGVGCDILYTDSCYQYVVDTTSATVSFTATDAAEYITLTFESGGYCPTSSMKIEKGTELGPYPVAQADGYIFMGWCTGNGDRVYEYTTFDSDTTLYAYWSTDFVNLGDSFSAYLGNVACGHGIVANNGNVELGESYTNASMWHFYRQTDGSYIILNNVNGEALDVYDAGTADWTNVWTYPSNGTTAQRWYIRQYGNGYVLHSACSDKVLDVYYGSSGSAYGENIQVYTLNEQDSQIMYIDDPFIYHSEGNMDLYNGVTRSLRYYITDILDGNIQGRFGVGVNDSNRILSYYLYNDGTNGGDYIDITPIASGTTRMTIYLYSEDYTEIPHSYFADITVYDAYTITFDFMNGTTDQKTVSAGQLLTIPTDVPWNWGKTFLGWSTSPTGSVKYKPGDSLYPSGSMTLYAIYQDAIEIPTTTTFIAGDAKPLYPYAMYWLKYTPSVTTSYEIKTPDTTIEQSGYLYDENFSYLTQGDYSSSDRQFRFSYVLQAGKTYYIGVLDPYGNGKRGTDVYVDRGYKITYNANGGTGAPSHSYVYCGDGGDLSLVIPTRSGYQFLGWATSSIATEAEYTAGEYVNIDEDTTLYAVWKSSGTLSVPAKPYKIANVVSGVHVYWKATEGAAKYGLWRSETGKDGTYKWLANPTVPHFTDTKVESGKTYYYKVTAMNAAGQHSDKSEAIGITYVSTPDITSRSNIAAGVKLGWEKVTGATGYAIYRKSYSGTDAWVRVGTISGNSTFTWTDTSVKNNNGTIYKYTIRALAGSDMKTLSGCRNAGRTMARLSSQVMTSAAKASATSIKCQWTTSSRVTGYEVRFMVGNTVYKTFTVGNYKTGVKTFTGLKAGQTYTIQVRTYLKVDGMGFYSDWSVAKTVKI